MIRVWLLLGLFFVSGLTVLNAEILSALDPADPWPVYMQNNRNTGNTIHKGLTVPQLKWAVPLSFTGNIQPLELAPVIVKEGGNNVVLIASESELHAYDAETSALLWKYVAEEETFIGKISVANVYTGTSNNTVKTIFAATDTTVHAIPLTPAAPLEDGIRTDTSLWANEATLGSRGGFTPISYKVGEGVEAEYRTIVIGTHLQLGQGADIVARNAYTGDLLWSYDDADRMVEDIDQQPAIGMSHEVEEDTTSINVYLAGSGSTTGNHLKAFRLRDIDDIDDVGQLTDNEGQDIPFNSPLPAWQANISDPPTSSSVGALQQQGVMKNGTFASVTIADNPAGGEGAVDQFIYVPSDNGVVYAFDRNDGSVGSGVPTVDSVDEFVQTNQTDPMAPYYDTSSPYLWNGDPNSATIGLFVDGATNMLFAAREHTGQMILSHDGTTPIELVDIDGESQLYGGVTVDSTGVNYFSGQGRNLEGDILFDLRNTDIALRNFFESVSLGSVMPIDEDGNIYTAGIDDFTGDFYLYAFEHGLLGDMNMDGDVNNDDTSLYIDALLNPSVYKRLADMNQSGTVTNADTALFVAARDSGSLMAVPEPNLGLHISLGLTAWIVLVRGSRLQF